MTIKIVNPSRGLADPSYGSEPVNVRALDPIRFSLRGTATYVDLSRLQTTAGFAKTHAIGTNTYDRLLPRTRRGSLYQIETAAEEPDISVSPPEVLVTKTSNNPQPSTYFTSVEGGARNVMVTAILNVIAGDADPDGPDPIGPVLALEHGPRDTAIYVFFLQDPSDNRIIRICGPSVSGARVPDIQIDHDWSVPTQYILVWNEERKTVELFVDSSTGAGIISSATLLYTGATTDFQKFGLVGSVRAGGAQDLTAIYGAEGLSGASVGIRGISLATDVGSPFINGARPGGFVTYLSSDVTMGFRGAMDPTQLVVSPWFVDPSNSDAAGSLVPSVGGYCRFLKKTAGKKFMVYRQESGLQRTGSPTLNGFMLEFKCGGSTSGGASFETDCAIVVSDGQTTFQLDFLNDGAVRNIGLLRRNGTVSSPGDHLLASSPVDWLQRRLRLVVNPRRNAINLFDTADLITPLGSWALDRTALPTATLFSEMSSQPFVAIGFVAAGSAVGGFDVYDFKYSYVYEAWESSDQLLPDEADPAFVGGGGTNADAPLNLSTMPGFFFPLPFDPGSSTGPGQGTALLLDEGLEIASNGGELLSYTRAISMDVNRGGVLEASLRITDWHPGTRSGTFMVLDDAIHAYMLSFVDTAAGKYVAIPLSAGSGSFQETIGDSGLGAKLSFKIDWTQFHTYRLERRPRDGVYLYIDNNQVPALSLADTEHYSFPATKLAAQAIGFGQFTEEGSISLWKFVRSLCGSGYDVSTRLNQPDDQLRARLSDARAVVIVTAAEV